MLPMNNSTAYCNKYTRKILHLEKKKSPTI